MRYVDHDPAAARAAAQRCREAADSYTRIATVLGADPRRVAWWGCERDQVVAAAAELADDLRREAGALHTSADLLEAAARAAERREADLAAEAVAAAAAARAAPCPVLVPGPSVEPSSAQRERDRGTTSHTGGAPVGVR